MDEFEGVMKEEIKEYNEEDFNKYSPARVILKKAKAGGLVISRVPDNTRNEFIKFADDNFAGDYGMVLVELWNNYKRSQFLETTFFENINLKLDYLISKIDKQEIPNQTEQKPTKEIKLLNGRVLKGGDK